MMSFTPSAKSSFVAGIGLWAVGWSALFKLDKIPLVKRLVTLDRKERMFDWMTDNKVVTLLATEACNFGVHGVSNPNSVTFALGGTFWNILMIFAWLPFRKYRRRKAQIQDILQGVA